MEEINAGILFGRKFYIILTTKIEKKTQNKQIFEQ